MGWWWRQGVQPWMLADRSNGSWKLMGAVLKVLRECIFRFSHCFELELNMMGGELLQWLARRWNGCKGSHAPALMDPTLFLFRYSESLKLWSQLLDSMHWVDNGQKWILPWDQPSRTNDWREGSILAWTNAQNSKDVSFQVFKQFRKLWSQQRQSTL